MRLTERKVVGFTCASHTMLHVAETYYAGLLLYIAADFHASLETMGNIGLPFYSIFGATAPLAGWAAGRFGSFRTLSIFLFGAAVSVPLIALSHSLWQLTIPLTMLGFFMGLYHPAGLSGISRLSRRPGRALGFHGFAGNFGLAAGYFFSVVLATWLGGSWRGSYALLAIPFVVLGVFVHRLAKLEPEAHEEANRSGRVSMPLDVHALVVLFILIGINGILYRMILTFLPARLALVFHDPATHLGVDPRLMGSVVNSAFFLVGAFGQLSSGYLSEHISLSKLLTGIFVISGICLIILGRGGMAAVAIAGFCFGVCFFATQPVVNGLLSRLTPHNKHGMIYGLSAFFTFGVGAAGAPIGGVIAERLSVGALCVVAGMVALLLAFGPMFLPHHRMERTA